MVFEVVVTHLSQQLRADTSLQLVLQLSNVLRARSCEIPFQNLHFVFVFHSLLLPIGNIHQRRPRLLCCSSFLSTSLCGESREGGRERVEREGGSREGGRERVEREGESREGGRERVEREGGRESVEREGGRE